MSNKFQQAPVNPNVPPAPKPLRCSNNCQEEGEFVIIQQKGGKVVCPKCKINRFGKESYFELKKVFYNPLEAFKHTQFPFHPLQHFSQYLLDQDSTFDENKINNWAEDLIEKFAFAVQAVQESLLTKLKKYREYFQSKNTINSIEKAMKGMEDEYEELKINLSKFKEGDQPSQSRVQCAIDDFCLQMIKQKKNREEDFRNDSIFIMTEEMRVNQKFFLNLHVKQEVEDKVLSIIAIGKNILSNNRFDKSKIALENMDTVFERIQNDVGERASLISSLELLYEKNGEPNLKDMTDKISQISKRNILMLIQATNNQKFGVYYNYTVPEKSLLFSLSKNVIFPAHQKKFEIIVPQQDQCEYEKPILTIGKDLIINGSLNNCISMLGDNFDLRGHCIANEQEFLADGEKFDIEKLEVFIITNKSIMTQNSLTTSINQPQVQPQIKFQTTMAPQTQGGQQSFQQGQQQFLPLQKK